MKFTIKAEKRYLWIPVYVNKLDARSLRLLSVHADSALLYHYMLPWREDMYGDPDYYASLPIADYCGRDLTIEVELSNVYADKITQSDEQYLPPIDSERPAFHYTAPCGWMNDPNGLIYVDGIYHLYYQHNPMNIDWGNMSWGHAVSADLVHFVHVSDVLFPDMHGVCYSGCALRNTEGAFGLPISAILFFYTATGDGSRLAMKGMATQRMAYSLDGGTTLIPYSDWCLPLIEDGNRDPKIFWDEPSGHYVMVLYLSGNRFAILISADLEHWEQTQRLDLPPMWECPDLFPLKSENGEVKYVFTSADGYYFIGDFDGEVFTKLTKMQTMFASSLPYASQTFSGLSGRTVQVCWLRIPNHGTLYTGAMGLPRELSLGKDEGGYYIRQRFVPEAGSYVTNRSGASFVRDSYIYEQISADGRLYRASVMQ